jgi:hypothetical protein
MIETVRMPKVKRTLRCIKEEIAIMSHDFKIFGLRDPETNLKDENFIPRYDKDPTHIDFLKCMKRREGQKLRSLVYEDHLSTIEW